MAKNVWKCALTAHMVLACTGIIKAQERQDSPETLRKQTDAKEVIHSIFSKKKAEADTATKPHSNFSTLPSAGFNPSVGFAIGVTSTVGKVFGNAATTTMSVLNANAYLSTKGLASFEFKNNIYTNNDGYNLQGNVQVGKTVALDYGVGTGRPVRGEGSFSVDGLPLANNEDIFPIKYTYIKISERIYKEIFPHVYAGAGVIFNIYNDIDDERRIGPNMFSHNFRYSRLNGFNSHGYSANGLLFNLQYNSRDHINRPYEGIYADIVLRTNEKWMGSDATALQLKTEFRKYWSLSRVNREHVLAFWYWGSFHLNGKIPYMELPGTGSDAANRLGRGYTISRFKGLSFMYSEAEYRFPILANKLVSGVVFANAQSASNNRPNNPNMPVSSNNRNVNVTEYVEPGGGVGLRLLFNKYTRSNLCIDYGVGRYGSKGIFIGLNEVF